MFPNPPPKTVSPNPPALGGSGFPSVSNLGASELPPKTGGALAMSTRLIWGDCTSSAAVLAGSDPSVLSSAGGFSHDDDSELIVANGEAD